MILSNLECREREVKALVMPSFGGRAELVEEPAKEAKTELPVMWEQIQKATVMERMRKTVSRRTVEGGARSC